MANNNKPFNIPIPLIIFAYFVNPVVGVILTILRVVASVGSAGSAGNYGSQDSAAAMRSRFEAERQAELNRQKNEAMREELNRQRQQQAQQRMSQTGTGSYSYSNPYYQAQTAKNGTRKAEPAQNKAAGEVRSDAYKGLLAGGIITAVIAGFSLLFAGLAADAILPFLAVVSIPALIAAGFFTGAHLVKNRDLEMSRLRKMIGQKESYNLSKLASASGKSLKKIRKQLQKMIDRGEFGDSAYIDLGTNNFMRNPDAEPDNPDAFDYRTVYGDLFAKKIEEQQKQGESTEPEDDSDEARFTKIIAEIRRLNGEIRDPQVSERIDRIEAHTRNIFDYVTEHPDVMPQIRTFMNYYLPTTLKLLESYSRIEKVGVAGENMKKSKENIENILDLLVVGFEQQVDQLFRNESIDITADISVLETMMQKDGLSGKSDFDITSYIKEEVSAQSAQPAEAVSEDEGFTDGWSDDIENPAGGAMGLPKPKK